MFSRFTVTQMLIAAGLARQLQRREICRIANCNTSYITRLLRDDSFNELVTMFKGIPFDKDTDTYKGIGTLYLDLGKLIYSYGEKVIHNVKQVM